VFTGVEIVTAEAVLGSGHTVVITWIFTVVSLIRIPLAFVVPQWAGLGVQGIAWVIAVTCAARALAIVMWAARGTWKRGLARELGTAPAVLPEAPGGP
jgi:Na+-driven multidrug efflux pump